MKVWDVKIDCIPERVYLEGIRANTVEEAEQIAFDKVSKMRAYLSPDHIKATWMSGGEACGNCD